MPAAADLELKILDDLSLLGVDNTHMATMRSIQLKTGV